MRSNEVLDCLAERYCAPEWVFTKELSLVPGIIRYRRADAVAMNCGNTEPWGQSVIGFEVKVSRSDFLAEIKDPKKRQETYSGCDVVFLAVPKGLVKVEEVPLDLGIIECWSKQVEAYGQTKTVRYTRIKRKPEGMDRLPVPAAMAWKSSGPGSYQYKELHLDKIKPMDRCTAVAIIRAFDPGRLNIDAHNKAMRLEYDQRELKYQNDRLKRALRQAMTDTLMP